jgi:4-oxalocrotonate tautomerase
MPLIQVSMARGRTTEQKRALLEAITRAVQESIGAPVASIRVWIHEFGSDEFIAGGEILADRQAHQDQGREAASP